LTAPLQIAVRVDASIQTGTGHVMRCRTLANALCAEGASVRFVSRHMPDSVRSLLERQGHEVVTLGGASSLRECADDLAHSSWLGVTQAQDARETLQALADRRWDWVIVDHYALDARWENSVRRIASRIMAIDDLADRQHECEVLLDQNLVANFESRYQGRTPRDCALLLGPRFALLDRSYGDLHSQVAPRTAVKRILIFFGGSDQLNLTGRALQAVLSLQRPEIEVDVVMSLNSSTSREIAAIAAQHAGIRCHSGLPSLAALFAAADLSIGSLGATSWERLCLGVPTLAILMAFNQNEVAAALHEAGLAICMGAAESVTVDSITEHLGRVLAMDDFTAWSARCMEVCDGRGTQRAMQALQACANASTSVMDSTRLSRSSP
jgi:UDP-2,4-diacetamido-2,4,6-trideoxy-beta-L-altropyranose hydrolase